MTSIGKPSGLGVRSADGGADIETGHNFVPQTGSYNVDLAEHAEERERNMTFKEALSFDRRLIMHSIGFSGTIIMEGYGLALITFLFSFDAFNRKYGAYNDAAKKWETDFVWKALLPLLAQIGSIVGVAIVPPLVNLLGYKRATQIMVVVSAALVCMPFFAPSIHVLGAGFFLQGIPWGVYQVISPAYASEVASVQLRPILTTWNNLCWVIGQLIAAGIVKGFEGLSTEMSYRAPFAIQWCFSVFLTLALCFAPESPYWHIQRGELAKADKAMGKLVRGGNKDLAAEKLALMQHTIHQEASADSASDVNLSFFQKTIAIFKGSDARRTEVACVSWLIQAMCGSSLIGWAPVLFIAAGLPNEDSLSINLALPSAGFVGTVASWWLMRVAGRRSIYFWGLIGMSVLLVGCGCASFAPDGKTAGWAAGGVLAVYTLVYDLTVGPICYSIVSEIPSVRRRATTLSVARCTYLLANLINHFLTPKMVSDDAGSWGWGAKTGFVYAGLCLLGATYTFFRLPETDGITARSLDILFQHNVPTREFSNAKAAQFEHLEQEKPLATQTSKTSVLSVRAMGGDKSDSA
ncbi:hypothetical protein QBC38DRAFT_481481 [Podospora fimiseda]|uniref:Major facilitator superfamily (MFS) profile domain-containing protein n=1 Tax=Podospora fimiseda TaxID=252190 RepID=A0AAN7BM29_9PEZI|nr:hypothetical protein QBC38DRAFT_481481 [Podospora fimiseda]